VCTAFLKAAVGGYGGAVVIIRSSLRLKSYLFYFLEAAKTGKKSARWDEKYSLPFELCKSTGA